MNKKALFWAIATPLAVAALIAFMVITKYYIPAMLLCLGSALTLLGFAIYDSAERYYKED